MIDIYTEILSNENITQDTFLLRFLSPELAASAEPGQFVMLKINEGNDPTLRRPFSICGTDEEGIVRIIYKVVGRGTRYLSDKKPGDYVSVLGPLGKGFKEIGRSKMIYLIAGGIGIAPLLFLCQKIESTDITFLTGFRTSGEIIDPALTGIETDNVIATDDGSIGYYGKVTNLLSERISRNNPGNICVYTCGPLPMLKAVRKICLENNIPCQVSMETFMACGLGVCQGCVVRSDISKTGKHYLHVCKEGPVFDIEKIDWDNV